MRKIFHMHKTLWFFLAICCVLQGSCPTTQATTGSDFSFSGTWYVQAVGIRTSSQPPKRPVNNAVVKAKVQTNGQVKLFITCDDYQVSAKIDVGFTSLGININIHISNWILNARRDGEKHLVITKADLHDFFNYLHQQYRLMGFIGLVPRFDTFAKRFRLKEDYRFKMTQTDTGIAYLREPDSHIIITRDENLTPSQYQGIANILEDTWGDAENKSLRLNFFRKEDVQYGIARAISAPYKEYIAYTSQPEKPSLRASTVHKIPKGTILGLLLAPLLGFGMYAIGRKILNRAPYSLLLGLYIIGV